LALAGFLATILVSLAPGFGTDERELDPRYSQSYSNRSGTDENVLAAYGKYLKKLAHGDLGVSTSLGRPVSELLLERAPATARTVSVGLVAAWIAAIAAASMSSITNAGTVRTAAAAASGAVLSVPSALVAFGTVLLNLPPWSGLAVLLFPRIHRYADNLFRTAERSGHVLAARARGVRETRIFSAHVLRNTLPQLLALAGASVNIAVGAAIPVEVLCDEAGLGQLTWRGAISRDVHLVVSTALMITSVTLLANKTATVAIEKLERVRT
jgi:peptide/nickel transport system permease protein